MWVPWLATIVDWRAAEALPGMAAVAFGVMGQPTRWVTDTDANHSQWYIDRFRRMATEGADLVGEARMIDAMVARGSKILDAGCGTGRIAGYLFEQGHRVVGVDADPALVAAAEQDHPGPTWVVADLAELDLVASGIDEPFDAAVCAGNVMAFLAPGTESQALAGVASHLVPDGFLVVGFGTDRGYELSAFAADVTAAGFELEHRFAAWDLRPWREDSGFAVSVLRRLA
jgi:SAM-dependent methyltransferase